MSTPGDLARPVAPQQSAVAAPVFARNNFDLIRLFAATQVAICHSAEMLSPALAQTWPIRLLGLFPGVPIFFFISGYLISRSFERSGTLGRYAQNRALRIFPGLQVCLLINLIAVMATGYFNQVGASFSDVLLLYLAKGSFLQFYNPDFMRGFGDGVLNGSLWTICVELQFYVLIPITYLLFLKKPGARTNLILLVLILVSLTCNRVLYDLQQVYSQSVLWKLFRVTFLPWIYMFLIGVWIQRNFHLVERLLARVSFPVALLGYIALAATLHFGFAWRVDNGVGPLLALPLFCTILLGAYTRPWLADRLLHGNDISYGIYIYHMPVVNMALYYKYAAGGVTLFSVLVISLGLAIASWLLVERPCLRRKPTSLHAPGKLANP